MLCPFCLEERDLVRAQKGLERYYTCDNQECREKHIPVLYGDDARIPKVPLCTVGFRGHGKTVYLAALFLSFEQLSAAWPKFYTLPLNAASLDIVNNNTDELRKHKVPLPSQKNTPTVAIIRFKRTPVGDRDFILYDTSGENFERLQNIQENASYIRHARYALFFIDLEEKDIREHPANGMFGLLQTYVLGMQNLNGQTRDQNLIVILAKSDQLESRLSKSPKIWDYLVAGDTGGLQHTPFPEYTKQMEEQSRAIRLFLENEIKANQFLGLCETAFRTVRFSIISSLGSAPIDGEVPVDAIPKRIFDPIFWVLKEPRPDPWLVRQMRGGILTVKQKWASLKVTYQRS